MRSRRPSSVAAATGTDADVIGVVSDLSSLSLGVLLAMLAAVAAAASSTGIEVPLVVAASLAAVVPAAVDLVTDLTRRVDFARRRCISNRVIMSKRISVPAATGMGFNWANSSQ